MWDVKILRVNRIEPIPDADKIELVYVGDWSVVSQKGLWQVGQLATYIPFDSILPDELIIKLGLVGKLSGAAKNRVKPIRLKGQLSIGLLAPAPSGVSEGDSVAEQLGITKYEQFIPIHLAGKVRSHPDGWSKYDIDNIRSDNHFIDGEEIVISSKLHGTSCSFALINNEFFVSSKNCTLEKDIENIYWKIAIEYDIENKMRAIFTDPHCPIWVYGEVFGGNIQKDF